MDFMLIGFRDIKDVKGLWDLYEFLQKNYSSEKMKVFNSKRLTLEGSVSPERETIGTWHRTRSRVYDDDLPDTFLIKTDARSPYPITGCQIRDVNFLMISENKAFYYLNLGEAEGDPRIVFEIETQPVPGDES